MRGDSSQQFLSLSLSPSRRTPLSLSLSRAGVARRARGQARAAMGGRAAARAVAAAGSRPWAAGWWPSDRIWVSGFSPLFFVLNFIFWKSLSSIYWLNENPSFELFMLLSLEILGLPNVYSNKNWILRYEELIPL